MWHVPGSTPISGDHEGRTAIFESFRKMGELSGGTFHAELVDALASDTHAVAVATATGKRGGKMYDGSYLADADRGRPHRRRVTLQRRSGRVRGVLVLDG